MECRRIVLKGTSGAGKTTLAAVLARRLSLANIELDALHHGPNWSAPTDEEFRARVQRAMAGAPSGWVIDGNYDSKLGDLTTGQADAIVWLDFSFGHKFRRLWRRTIDRIRHDSELWNGNRETWRGAFLGRDSLFVWMTRAHFRHRREWPDKFGGDPRLIRIRTEAQLASWLASLRPATPSPSPASATFTPV